MSTKTLHIEGPKQNHLVSEQTRIGQLKPELYSLLDVGQLCTVTT